MKTKRERIYKIHGERVTKDEFYDRKWIDDEEGYLYFGKRPGFDIYDIQEDGTEKYVPQR